MEKTCTNFSRFGWPPYWRCCSEEIKGCAPHNDMLLQAVWCYYCSGLRKLLVRLQLSFAGICYWVAYKHPLTRLLMKWKEDIVLILYFPASECTRNYDSVACVCISQDTVVVNMVRAQNIRYWFFMVKISVSGYWLLQITYLEMPLIFDIYIFSNLSFTILT